MPNRILRESICTSDSIDKLSWFEEVLFYRLMVNCDDFGRFDGRAAVVKNLLFPLKDGLQLKSVENALHRLEDAGLVTLYVFEGKRFLALPTWCKYQIPRAKESKYPAPEDGTKANDSTCKHMSANDFNCKHTQADVPVLDTRDTILDTRDTRGGNVAPAPAQTGYVSMSPPTVEDVAAYAQEKGLALDPAHFVDFYTSKGWKVGREPMKDWKAACRNWVRQDRAFGRTGNAVQAKPSGQRQLDGAEVEAIRRLMEEKS